ncbi:hypothetical protein ACFQU9_11145 [Actinomadura namibiensis]|uniref:Uncharacterized protein n=1 Tax=Actinomadura namibiensis TaxID=182080 RepID=A0A7W3QR37_ACTNM|nr:hypothetical protein [Actinomadura namibiensis]MBA8956339.1 hypothetical protein [Actinomadura namibiensis]
MDVATRHRPPPETLGHPVPVQQFVTRTDRAVVALRHVIAFREGCALVLHLAARRGSMEEREWKDLLARQVDGDPARTPDDGDLRFGVRFPDGTGATTAGTVPHGRGPAADRPEPPLLTETDATSSSSERLYEGERRLWLWPLPPPVPFEFVIDWRALGIDTATATVDGSAIRRAAEQAMPYWT